METYYGQIKTPADAIKLFEACRMGIKPRVQRRLSEKERQLIRSGSVFVWDEREAGMRRWTDGKSWSASRVSGSFLTYREMEGKRGGGGSNFNGGRRGAGKTPDSGRGSEDDQDDGEPDGLGYRYKADGLMKQSFSISTQTGQHLHLISYYTRSATDLPQPSTDPALRHIVPPKGMYPESSMNDAGPPSTRAPMPPHYSPHNPPYMHTPWQQQQPYGHWPHSPVSTPPYQQGPYNGGPYHEQPHLPALQHGYGGHPHQPPYHHQPHPQQHPHQSHPQYPPPHYSQPPQPHTAYPGHHSAYQQGPLPNPSNQLPPIQLPHQAPPSAPSSLQPSAQHALPPPRSPPGPPLSHESPRSQQLLAAARQAVGTIDPYLAGRNQSHAGGGTLPPLTMPRQNGNSASHIPSPPSRTLSLSPANKEAPGSAVSASKQPSLSAILDAPPSEPTSATSTSSSGQSPRSAPIKELTNGIASAGTNGNAGAGNGQIHERVVKNWAP
ncbi:Gti1/Pac2 family-domain-containing protein [Podospora fimiseda]|uniref:Gti1/Pac2 family-domain-containing protein n=1 Tax=Podospora fimiseda TaxID=252190 RepID=A0AAN7H256_9PEZI|nr:Gti1/Pac2 family-domain-containing protein [Podospora fimiseda]